MTADTPPAAAPPPAPAPDQPKKLYRSRSHRMIGGVCGGLGDYFGIDPTLVRVGWVLGTIFTGFFAGIIGYIIMMVVIPEEP